MDISNFLISAVLHLSGNLLFTLCTGKLCSLGRYGVQEQSTRLRRAAVHSGPYGQVYATEARTPQFIHLAPLFPQASPSFTADFLEEVSVSESPEGGEDNLRSPAERLWSP